MPLIQINDIEMYYEQKGQGEPLLLISGLSANHKTWEKMVEDLSQRFMLIMPDNRGAGKTTQPQALYTIDEMADDMVALLDALGVPSAHMLGHSMGGMIVQKIAINHSAKVKSAILAGTTAKSPKTLKMQNTNSINLTKAGTDLKLIIDEVMPWLFASGFLDVEENVQAETKRMLEEPDPQSFAGFIGQCHALEKFDVSDQLHHIKCPTLVIGGSEDILILLKHQQYLKDHIPNAKLAVIDNCAHMFQREKPQEFKNLIVDFIDSI